VAAGVPATPPDPKIADRGTVTRDDRGAASDVEDAAGGASGEEASAVIGGGAGASGGGTSTVTDACRVSPPASLRATTVSVYVPAAA